LSKAGVSQYKNTNISTIVFYSSYLTRVCLKIHEFVITNDITDNLHKQNEGILKGMPKKACT
jgi:hypothetical protein